MSWQDSLKLLWTDPKKVLNMLIHFQIIFIVVFIALGFTSASLIYVAENRNVTFDDASLLAFSASTNSALTPFEMSTLSTWTFVIIGTTMVLGNPIVISVFPVLIRRYEIRKQVAKPSRAIMLEYQALRFLLWTVIGYFVSFLVLGFFLLATYASANAFARDLIISRGFTPVGWAGFQTLSAFSNVGLSLFSDNMIPFAEEPYPLLILITLTLFGNTAFPIALRLIVYCCHLLSRDAQIKRTWEFLLNHPRRCYTHLFLPQQTRWLLLTLFFINLIQTLMFLGMTWNEPVLAGLSSGNKVMNAMFAAVVTRSSGYYSVIIGNMPNAVLVLYLGAMYISSTPVVAAVRASDLASESNPPPAPPPPPAVNNEAESSVAALKSQIIPIPQPELRQTSSSSSSSSSQHHYYQDQSTSEPQAKPSEVPQKDVKMEPEPPMVIPVIRIYPPEDQVQIPTDMQKNQEVPKITEVQVNDSQNKDRQPSAPSASASTSSNLSPQILQLPQTHPKIHLEAGFSFRDFLGVPPSRPVSIISLLQQPPTTPYTHDSPPQSDTPPHSDFLDPHYAEVPRPFRKFHEKLEAALLKLAQEQKDHPDSDSDSDEGLGWNFSKIKRIFTSGSSSWSEDESEDEDEEVEHNLRREIRKKMEEDYVRFLNTEVTQTAKYINADLSGTNPFLIQLQKDSLAFQVSEVLTDNSFLVYLAIFVVTIIENDNLQSDPNFTVFKIIFELISGFGNVGLSMGYPGSNKCFSAYWHPLSKYIVIAVMFLGRLRNLPKSIDRSVLPEVSADLEDRPPAEGADQEVNVTI